MSLDTKWVVMKIINRSSQYGNIIQEVTFANAEYEIAHTYVDDSNQNYANWQDIVDLYDRGCGVIVRGLRTKKGKFHRQTNEPLVNADSPVKIRHVELDRQNVLDQLVLALG